MDESLLPFLTPNDKDLTSKDITPEFFNKNSVLFMSFPDQGKNSFSLPMIKKYTESDAAEKIVIVIIHCYDLDESKEISISKDSKVFLKANYDLDKTIDSERFEDQPTQLQIYCRKGGN